MGAWGDKPWENDSAADFFDDLFPADFHDKVMAGLRSEDEDEARAAAWLVSALAHSGYIWPGDPEQMAEACHLAATRLEQLATEAEEDGELEYGEQLRREAAELQARRHRPLGM